MSKKDANINEVYDLFLSNTQTSLNVLTLINNMQIQIETLKAQQETQKVLLERFVAENTEVKQEILVVKQENTELISRVEFLETLHLKSEKSNMELEQRLDQHDEKLDQQSSMLDEQKIEIESLKHIASVHEEKIELIRKINIYILQVMRSKSIEDKCKQEFIKFEGLAEYYSKLYSALIGAECLPITHREKFDFDNFVMFIISMPAVSLTPKNY